MLRILPDLLQSPVVEMDQGKERKAEGCKYTHSSKLAAGGEVAASILQTVRVQHSYQFIASVTLLHSSNKFGYNYKLNICRLQS